MTKELRQLTEDIRQCECCNLHVNGKILPEVGEYANSILLLDHPKPDMEECMDKFWELFREVGLALCPKLYYSAGTRPAISTPSGTLAT